MIYWVFSGNMTLINHAKGCVMLMEVSLEVRFHQEMIELSERTKRETNYNPSQFTRMLGELGGVKTAKKLLTSKQLSDGYTKLWEMDRLDLTLEAFINDNEEYSSLFSPEELEIAKKRLEEFGYKS